MSSTSSRERLETCAWFALAIANLIGWQYLRYGGYEWYLFREVRLTGFMSVPGVANPPYAGILLYPLAPWPARGGIFLFITLSIGCYYLVHRLTGVNKWLLLLSYPGVRVLFSAS
jgi:hypothetical protein